MKPVLSFGRIMLGLAYVVYGYLHFAHTAADAAMVPQGVGRPVVWVILIGICWWAVALSFFTNILTRLSGVLASVLLFFVLFLQFCLISMGLVLGFRWLRFGCDSAVRYSLNPLFTTFLLQSAPILVFYPYLCQIK